MRGIGDICRNVYFVVAFTLAKFETLAPHSHRPYVKCSNGPPMILHLSTLLWVLYTSTDLVVPQLGKSAKITVRLWNIGSSSSTYLGPG